jgi:AcrR family transcriptional regulator
MSDRTPARGPGRPARLSRETVVDAAEGIVDRDGIDALTMRRLADSLGVSPMAVYRHVADKDELLMALIERQAALLPRPALEQAPRERLLQLYGLLHDGLRQSPWIVEVLVKGDMIAPSVLWIVDAILAAFLEAGLSPQRAADAYHAAWRYTIGELTVTHETARHMATLRRPPLLRTLLAEADPQQLPALTSLGRELAGAREGVGEGESEGEGEGDSGYRRGLAAIIDGLIAVPGD